MRGVPMEAQNYLHLSSQELIPEYFTLRFESEPPAVVLGFQEEVLDWLLYEMHKWPIFKGYEELARGKAFSIDRNKGIGFGEVLKRYQATDLFWKPHFPEFSVQIPVIETLGGNCKSCKGSGKDSDCYDCNWCSGTGKNIEMVWDTIEEICLTLAFMSRTIIDSIPANLPRKNSHHQIMTFLMVYPNGNQSSAFITATLSKQVAQFLLKKKVEDISEIGRATKLAYKTMFPNYNVSAFSDFGVWVQDGRLAFDVPGNATGLLVDGSDRVDGTEAINLYPHNVDSMPQQLGLLCGLAALSGLVIKNR